MVLLSSLWSYDFSAHEFCESAVSSIYRDRLAQISGKVPKDIIDELKVRANILKVLAEKNIKEAAEVAKFCREYAANAKAAISGLGLTREDLLHS
jgi:hypothetical protein